MKLQQKTIEKLRLLINEETEYRTGQALVRFFNRLGFKDVYGQGFPSRWVYTENSLAQINGTPRMEECIKMVLSPVNFIGKFDQLNKHISDLNQYLMFDGYKVSAKGKDVFVHKNNEDVSITDVGVTEDTFLSREFKSVSIEKLGFDGAVTDVLRQRMEEVRRSLEAKSSLAVIFLCGSTLEGILLGVASRYPKEFNLSASSPRRKEGAVKPLQEWTLSNFIDVAHELKFLGDDVHKFSHSLRDFRNYIHPYEQMASGFSPDEHTAKICTQVLMAAIAQLTQKL